MGLGVLVVRGPVAGFLGPPYRRCDTFAGCGRQGNAVAVGFGGKFVIKREGRTHDLRLTADVTSGVHLWIRTDQTWQNTHQLCGASRHEPVSVDGGIRSVIPDHVAIAVVQDHYKLL